MYVVYAEIFAVLSEMYAVSVRNGYYTSWQCMLCMLKIKPGNNCFRRQKALEFLHSAA